jgi:hypothetical protein
MGSREFMHRMRVLLPDPEGPITTTTSPSSTAKSTSFKTWKSPKYLLTPSKFMMLILVGRIA